MFLKLFAAKKIFFQLSSFIWLCNNFIAIQLSVYKKTCLLSTWQKPAEVALRKRKWEGYFLGAKISIQDWKQDGKRLKQTFGFPVQGSFHSSAQDYLRWIQETGTWTRAEAQDTVKSLWGDLIKRKQMEKLQGKLNVLIRSCLVMLGVHEKAFFLWLLKGHRIAARNTKQRGKRHEWNPYRGGARPPAGWEQWPWKGNSKHVCR